MAAVLVVFLLVLLLGGVGFAVHVVWLLAAVVFVLWLIGFVARATEDARWYRW